MSVIFGKWMNVLPTVGALAAVGGLCTVVGGFWYWATPKFWEVGYMPTQPGGGFNHQLHAGKLGMDCRYCHTNVEKSPEANIPPVATCNGCHAENNVQLPEAQHLRTAFIREAYAKNESIPWRRVHKLPDYVRNFPHNAHVAAGVSCYQCHGQMTGQPVVNQVQPLSMAWCLECHRDTPVNPENRLVPPGKVTDLFWVQTHFNKMGLAPDPHGAPEDASGAAPVEGFSAEALYNSLQLNPPTNCGACHY